MHVFTLTLVSKITRCMLLKIYISAVLTEERRVQSPPGPRIQEAHLTDLIKNVFLSKIVTKLHKLNQGLCASNVFQFFFVTVSHVV